MKKTIKILVKAVSFVLVFLLTVNFLSVVFIPKSGYIGDKLSYITKSYKAEKDNSINVFFVGNSDVYRAISPPEIWNKTHISSCVSGKGCQSVGGAYKITKDMYKNQSPSVVVIETDMLFSSASDYTKGAKAKKRVADTKKIVKTLLTDFDNAAISGISYYFPLFKYHDRWNGLKLSDIKHMNDGYKSQYKGFLPDSSVNGYAGGFDYMQVMNKETKISKRINKNFQKIINLCEKHGSKVILLEVPSASSWSMSRHNAVQSLADANGLDFIDMNVDVPNGFDWSIHSIDGGDHLNVQGSIIVSDVISEYLVKKCGTKDNHTKEEQTEWTHIYAAYISEAKKSA